MELVYESLYIGGKWVAPSSARTIEVVSASTEQVIGRVPEAAEADIDAAVAAARTAFDDPVGWSSWEPAERAAVMERLAVALDARAGETARRVSSQNGLPISIANAVEGGFPQLILRYYAGLIRTAVLDEARDGLLGGKVRVRRTPVGVVGAIVPWNLPMTLAAFKLGPALAAGCTLVLKPSPGTVLDAQLFAEAVDEAGFPPGVINIVQSGREGGAHLVSHPGVDKVAFTGSTAAGRQIAETCGRLLRPVTLELGGKSAAIVLDDADLSANPQDLFLSTMVNNGQTCHLTTRILAPASRYDEIVETFTGFAAGLAVGDALDPATQIGPLASAAQRERVEGYIAKGLAEGARLTTGGGRPAGQPRGWFVEPTVFADVDNHSTIAREEIFGPVLSIIKYETDEEAITLANDSPYGLGGTVWTTDPARGQAVASRIRTGTIGVNTYTVDPAAPFGGVKDSGLGRELGPEGLTAYQALQSMHLQA
ncbi:aldehyde dehydrogenase [Amycolatopsis sp. FBCC-B4732]|uniref:aldehyde dehydrogenase n=1 Tax=Amycolatopsis sp. FBCC-B4732 TaxID=3079339 RepID=UPI001FF2BD47|nr:aldehyde dehydrogenase [Amycolatopsis sp. FBCC-B4732]UOX91066.1 aldehyde dehydrogenase [Amycolatopsis sp. FBCC-B4732]